ncbi:YuiB family protein [Pullulanibacillus sp. KACC 23026]|uniref:YuiB family protein n=1 Tax=Pullulanibacillus sp. KACC 23026 TaxID=3028315 RepID=UPI0023B0E763|nr:YuiB family protein [Pullulanibacillus sp. KACC 23026]WEG13789.1 YuiB family protein [Pullulanibacillus sp. KACC 23026]
MHISLPQFILSMLLFAVLFFGIGFILNMLLKTTWLVSVLYPFIILIVIDHVSTWSYFSAPRHTFSQVGARLSHLAPSDWTVLGMGFLGALLSGITMKLLRSRGYSMF